MLVARWLAEAAAEGKEGGEAGGLTGANTPNALELGLAGAGEAVERAKLGEELVSDAEGIGLSEEEGEQFGRGKGVAAVVMETV